MLPIDIARWMAVGLFGPPRRKKLQQFTLTATTSAPNQTVTIDRLTPAGGSIEIDWGDGGAKTTVNDGDTSSKAHQYAAAGTYPIKVSNPERITQIDLRDAKLGGLDTGQIKNNAITYFYCTGITGSTIDSADMAAWRPSNWWLYSMPAGGTYTIDSADMAAWRPSTWYLNSMPAGAYTIDSADMAAWMPGYWYLASMPAGGTYTIDSADMVAWRPSTWRLYSMPAGGAYTISSADMVAWRPSAWQLSSMPAGSITISAGSFDGWTSCTDFRVQDNALAQPQVDAILASLWTMFASRTAAGGTISVSGSNAAPSGVFQAGNPPTTGKEYAYELLNDSQNINPTKKWATVAFTA